MEQDSVDDSFDANERGGDELDDSRFIVWSIHISGTDWLGEAIVGYFVFFDETPVEAIDWGSTIDESFGGNIFIEGVFQDR